mmetsp:Transcript_24964/g.83664  ORF Transcript_24964/g.83664 Transcript_24964/m.83664 type:complete len:340 (+) Transcript_24964:73-1092(+)
MAARSQVGLRSMTSARMDNRLPPALCGTSRRRCRALPGTGNRLLPPRGQQAAQPAALRGVCAELGEGLPQAREAGRAVREAVHVHHLAQARALLHQEVHAEELHAVECLAHRARQHRDAHRHPSLASRAARHPEHRGGRHRLPGAVPGGRLRVEAREALGTGGLPGLVRCRRPSPSPHMAPYHVHFDHCAIVGHEGLRDRGQLEGVGFREEGRGVLDHGHGVGGRGAAGHLGLAHDGKRQARLGHPGHELLGAARRHKRWLVHERPYRARGAERLADRFTVAEDVGALQRVHGHAQTITSEVFRQARRLRRLLAALVRGVRVRELVQYHLGRRRAPAGS